MSLRDEQLAWLDKVLAETGLTRHALAKKAGIPPPTLSMFVSDKATHNLSSGNVNKIEVATGLRFGQEPAKRGALRAPESEPYKGPLPINGVDATSLFGLANGVDPWTLRSRALETAGYIPGDIMIVDLNAEPKPGDIVCAQVYDWSGARADTIFRIWEPPYLQVATYDPVLRKVYTVDNDRVFIAGVVICSLRGRLARAA